MPPTSPRASGNEPRTDRGGSAGDSYWKRARDDRESAVSDSEREKRNFRQERFSSPTTTDVHNGMWRPVANRPPTPAGQGANGILAAGPPGATAARSGNTTEDDSPPPSPSRSAPHRKVRAPSAATAATALLTAGAAVGIPSAGATPLTVDPVRFHGEFAAPLPAGHVFPRFDRIALYEHSGAFREAWAARGLRAASVCRRPSMTPPSPGCHHYKMEVASFLQLYPHPIPFITSHVDCGSANWASHLTWPDKIASGELLASSEELLRIVCTGDRAAAEQPPTAHACILGAPTFKLQACDAGGTNLKTLWWWCRGVSTVRASSEPTPAARRVDAKASASGTKEEVMVQRSTFEPTVAAHHVATWEAQIKTTPAPDGAGRMPTTLCPDYEPWRRTMLHNYSIFAARYAPTVHARALLQCGAEHRLIIFCPVAPWRAGMAFLTPLDGTLYAVRYDPAEPLEEQTETAARFFHASVKPQMACCTTAPPRHFVVAIPRADDLVDSAVLTEPGAMADAAERGAEHAWCASDALAEAPMYMYAMLIHQRAQSRREAVPFMMQGTGAWSKPRPVVRGRAAFDWNHAGPSPSARAAWQEFLQREERRRTSLQTALMRASSGSGSLSEMATRVTTAADHSSALIPPAQGLPIFDAPGLEMKLLPERPAPLLTAWLRRLPPQRVPPGADAPVSWQRVLKGWARRKICDSLNLTADHDFHAWDCGVSNGRRPKFLAIGEGGFKDTPHLDGIGTYNESVIIRRRRPDGLLVPLDFDAEYQDHKKLDFIKSQLGDLTDKELLSFLFGGGTSWKMTQHDGTGPPHQIRIAHNLDSLPDRIRGVSKATMKLVKANRYDLVRVRRRGSPKLTPNDASCPTMYTPQWSVGIGGTDKKGSDEKRKVGDASVPHEPVHAMEHPHGEPNGPVVLSPNALTGPSKIPRDYDGPPVPFPDRETKHRPRHIYGAAAVMHAMLEHSGLAQDGWFITSTSSDVRWMFFQFFTRVAEYWLQVFYFIVEFVEEDVVDVRLRGTLPVGGDATAAIAALLVLQPWMVETSNHAGGTVLLRLRTAGATRHEAEALAATVTSRSSAVEAALGGLLLLGIAVLTIKLREPELWFCSAGEKVMNMGSRPASKIACRFNEEWTDVWRRLMYAYVTEEWLRRQPKRLTVLLEQRSAALGPRQGLPFQAELYTDDNVKLYLDDGSHDLTVHGAKTEVWLNEQANIWMSGYEAGTAPLWCGALFVLNGGFGTVLPPKRNRAILDATRAVAGTITYDQLERHNAFCVHLEQILDFPIGTRDGMWGPLKRPHVPTAEATPTVASRRANETILHLLGTKTCASFMCAIEDFEAAPEQRRMWIHIASDSCFRISPPHVPHIYGCAPGVCWRFPLTGEWANRHVTVTEACGRALNEIILAPLFPHFELLFESDNTMALAMSQETSSSDPAQYVAWRKRQEPTYAAVARRSWDTHTAGFANGVTDAGSRDRQDVVEALSAVDGNKMTEIDISRNAVVQRFMDDVLENTPHYEPPERGPPVARCGDAPSGSTRRAARAVGAATFAAQLTGTNAAQVGLQAAGALARPLLPPILIAAIIVVAIAVVISVAMMRREELDKWWLDRFPSVEAISQDLSRGAVQTDDGAIEWVIVWGPPVARRGCVVPMHDVPLCHLCGGLLTYERRGPGGSVDFSDLTRNAAACCRGWRHAGKPADYCCLHTISDDEILRIDYMSTLTPQQRAGLLAREADDERDVVVEDVPPDAAGPSAAAGPDPAANGSGQGGGTDDTGPSHAAPPPQGIGRMACPELSPAEAAAQLARCRAAAARRRQEQADAEAEQREVRELLRREVAHQQRQRQARADAEDAAADALYRVRMAEERQRRRAEYLQQAQAGTNNSGAGPSGGAAYLSVAVPDQVGATPEHQQRLQAFVDEAAPRYAQRRAEQLEAERLEREELTRIAEEQWQRRQPAREQNPRDEQPPPDPPASPPPPHHVPAPHTTGGSRARRDNSDGDGPLSSASPEGGQSDAHLRDADVSRLRQNKVEAVMRMQPASPANAPQHGPTASSSGAGGLQATSPDAVATALGSAAADAAARALAARSPQPADAQAARARATAEISGRLLADDSPYALCVGDASMMRAAVMTVADVRAAGRPRGTTKRDDWGFRWMARYCAASGNAVMRPRAVAPHEEIREAYYGAYAIIWMAMYMLPSARRRQRGYTEAMPSSSLQAYYGWRGVQRECGRWVPPTTLLLQVLRGLNELYKQRWGASSLVAERTEPFPLWALHAMARALAEGAVLRDEAERECYRIVFLFAVSAAPRLDEICYMGPGDTFYARDNFVWYHNGRAVAAAPGVLERLLAAVQSGSRTVMLKGTSAPSKADRMNTTWGGRDMWFRPDPSNPLNFAFFFLKWEIAHPCPLGARAQWPAFSLDGGETPLSAHTVRTWHAAVAIHVLGATAARLRTFHAFRATLASALAAYRDKDGRPMENFEGVAQMLVRWKSVESVRVYMKIRDVAYADYVDIVTHTDGSHVSGEELPPLGPEDGADDVGRAIAQLSGGVDGDDSGDSGGAKRKGDGDPETTAVTARVRARTNPSGDARSRALAKAPSMGQRVQINRGGDWWDGVSGTTRWSDADDAFITRIAYDAANGWNATSEWHATDDMEWRTEE